MMKYLLISNLYQYFNLQQYSHLNLICVQLILNQSLKALRYLYYKNVMYKDIKLKNILMIINDPIIKIVNFNLFC